MRATATLERGFEGHALAQVAVILRPTLAIQEPHLRGLFSWLIDDQPDVGHVVSFVHRGN